METPEKKQSGKTGLRILIAALLCALSAAGGFFGNEYYTRYKESLIVPEPICTVEGHIPAGDVRVRVDGGDVQWYDGRRWSTVASAETLMDEDRYEAALQDYEAFEQELLAQREAQAAAEAAQAAEAGEEGAETQETAAISSRIQLPETGQKVVWYGGGGGSGGGGSGGSGGGGGGGNDGQDIQWSGDYL